MIITTQILDDFLHPNYSYPWFMSRVSDWRILNKIYVSYTGWRVI